MQPKSKNMPYIPSMMPHLQCSWQGGNNNEARPMQALGLSCLLLPLLRGAGPMASMLWLDGMMMMMLMKVTDCQQCNKMHSYFGRATKA
jgi:hypothetical protein